MANLTQTTTPETGGDVLTGSQIIDDAWNYGISVQGGAFGLGANSPAIAAFSISDESGYFLETGPVVDQTFASGAYTPLPMPNFYVGSDFTTLY